MSSWSSTSARSLLCPAGSGKRPSISGREIEIDFNIVLPAKAPLAPPKDPSSKLFARSASCDVTPRDRPVRLAGYASRTSPVATILDPIEISAVLLECGGSAV